MKVTPLDIRRKEFKRAMRGYADEEVDVFLDDVADEFERLFQENIELQDRIARQDEQISRPYAAQGCAGESSRIRPAAGRSDDRECAERVRTHTERRRTEVPPYRERLVHRDTTGSAGPGAAEAAGRGLPLQVPVVCSKAI